MKTQINNTLLLATMLFVGFFTPIKADEPKKLRVGFRASPNVTWTKILDGKMSNNGLGIGFSYGLMADVNIAGNQNYWIGTELLISSFPVKVKSTIPLYNSKASPYTFNNVEFDYTLQYIQLPLSLKLKTNEIGNFTYWGQFGVGPSFLIRNKVRTQASEQYYQAGTTNHSPNSSSNDLLDFDGDVSGNGDFEDNVVPLRLPLILGAGIEGKISGSVSWVAGIRLDNSFTDLFWDKNVNGRNNYLGLMLGIFF